MKTGEKMELNKVRTSVKLALSDIHYTQAGILDVQLQQMEMGSTGRFNDKATRTMVIDGHEFVTPAEVVRYHEGKKFKTSSAPIAEIDFVTSSWRRAILKLAEHEKCWIYFAYGDGLNFEVQTTVCFYLWDEFQKLHKSSGFKEMKKRTTGIMRRLAFYCMQETRYGLLGLNVANKEEFQEDRKISALLDISIESWRKDYKKRWHLMKQVCFNLDEGALRRTAEVRHEQFSCSRERRSNMSVQTDMAPAAGKATG